MEQREAIANKAATHPARDWGGGARADEVSALVAQISQAATRDEVLAQLSVAVSALGVGRFEISTAARRRAASAALPQQTSVGLNGSHLVVACGAQTTPAQLCQIRAIAEVALARLEALKRTQLIPQRAAGGGGAGLARELARLARSPFNVLLLGERGTGKTTLARALHDASARRGGPFIAFNCATLTEHLAEAELFGYRKGAFTGASSDHPGLFEAAAGGTLFLDEIAELSAPLQAKLLKAVEERRIRRIGEAVERPVNVRLIAATARDLNELVARGAFRADLYDRLATLTHTVEPLRRRREEIPGLVAQFLREAGEAYAADGAVREFRIEDEALRRLVEARWPGNIRELKNAIATLTTYLDEGQAITREQVADYLRRTAPGRTTCDGERGAGVEPTAGAEASDLELPDEVRIVRADETLDAYLDRVILHAIRQAQNLAGSGEKWERASARLGLKRNTLRWRYRTAVRRLQRETAQAPQLALPLR